MKVKFHTSTALQLKVCGQYNQMLLTGLSAGHQIGTLIKQLVSKSENRRSCLFFPFANGTYKYTENPDA